MGSTKISTASNQQSTSTSTPTPTAEETALNQRNLRIAQATEGGETQAQVNSLNLINQLLMGNLPQGDLYKMIGGIDPQSIAAQATQMMRSGRTGFQSMGLQDSGIADRAITKDVANNLLFPASQFNVGAGQNMLNLALSGQAQVQSPVQNNVNGLSQSLAGLRSTTSTTKGTGSGAQYNPFNGLNLGVLGTWGGSNYCWVAAEIFGGWNEPKTCAVRFYIGNIAPDWLRNFYIKHGERIAKFIHKKNLFKKALKPLFEYFVKQTVVFINRRGI